MRPAIAMLIGAIAIGSFVADFWFLDFFGPFIVVIALPLLPMAIVGAFLVVRRVGGPIGWLLGAAGALLQLVLLSNAYGYTSREPGAALPGGEVAMWLGSFIWIAALGLVVSAMVRFPDGRPPGRTFAVLLWVFVAVVVIGAAGVALADQPIVVPPPFVGPHAGDPSRSIRNPLALHGPVGDLMLLVASAIDNFLALVLIAPVALVVRFRRSRGVEREQLKWLTYTAAITFGLYLLAFVSPRGITANLAQTASVIGIGLLPVAIGIAVTRNRLYDIDVLIRRTLIYATVSALLVATYLGGLALFQFVLAPFTSGSPIAVAVSTLSVVALFQPLRRRIGSAVDRRFYRSKYDAERTLDAFAARLRDEVDLEAVRADLLDAVYETIQPAHVSVWLRR